MTGSFDLSPAFSGTVHNLFVSNTTAVIPGLMIEANSFMSKAVWDLAGVNGSLFHFVSAMLKGNDTIYGAGLDETLAGFGGNDVLVGGAGGDELVGGDGIDTASYANAAASVVVVMLDPGFNQGDADGDTYFGIENLAGSRFNDFLYANDSINRVSGGLGNDTLVGMLGADTLDGGAGTDTASYDDGLAVTASLLTPGINTSAAKGDKYISIENLAGSSFNDTLYGNNAANKVEGNNDPALTTIIDNDKLFGLGGNDQLFGGWGIDTLTGGLGKDALTGGGSRDIFDFNLISESVVGANRDIIMDFTRGSPTTGDDIDLSTIDANTTLAGNQNFTWRGTGAFTSLAGQLRFTDQGPTCLVQGDVNGDGKADFEIMVSVATLGIGDFIL